MVQDWWPLVECRIAVSSAITCFPPWIALQQPTNTNINTIRMAPMLLLFVLIQKQLQHRCFFWYYLFFSPMIAPQQPTNTKTNKMTSSTFILEPSPSLPCLDFSKLNCQNWYTDLSKMLTGFVNVAKWIC